MEEGSLYPALQRLELNGWIEGEWGVSANNRRARFYKLTADAQTSHGGISALPPSHGAVARIMGSPGKTEGACNPVTAGGAFDAVYAIV